MKIFNPRNRQRGICGSGYNSWVLQKMDEDDDAVGCQQLFPKIRFCCFGGSCFLFRVAAWIFSFRLVCRKTVSGRFGHRTMKWVTQLPMPPALQPVTQKWAVYKMRLLLKGRKKNDEQKNKEQGIMNRVAIIKISNIPISNDPPRYTWNTPVINGSICGLWLAALIASEI